MIGSGKGRRRIKMETEKGNGKTQGIGGRKNGARKLKKEKEERDERKRR